MEKVSIGENILSVIYSIYSYMSQKLLLSGFAIRQHVNYLEK